MDFLTELAQRKIAQALADGELDNLPGAGRPLPDDDIDPLVPQHQRMAWRVLKNSGYLPPELELHKTAVELALRLASSETEVDVNQWARLEQLNVLLAQTGHRGLCIPDEYLGRISEKLSWRYKP